VHDFVFAEHPIYLPLRFFSIFFVPAIDITHLFWYNYYRKYASYKFFADWIKVSHEFLILTFQAGSPSLCKQDPEPSIQAATSDCSTSHHSNGSASAARMKQQ
jgi:hypothetical protein